MASKSQMKNLFIIITGILTAALLAPTTQGQSRVPHFRDYPVAEAYRGKPVPPVLTRDDRMFKTRLRWATRHEKPNFAGHYILTYWGCGTSCVMGAVIDAKSGKVYWWNFTVCCWPYDVDDKFEPIEVRLNSKLIVFSGARNEKEDDVGTHFYKFQNGKFVHITSVLKGNSPSDSSYHPTIERERKR